MKCARVSVFRGNKIYICIVYIKCGFKTFVGAFSFDGRLSPAVAVRCLHNVVDKVRCAPLFVAIARRLQFYMLRGK